MNEAPTGTVTFLFTDIAGSTKHWERDADYFGSTVNRVARLLAVGHSEQVLLSLSIANHRITSLDDDHVAFVYKDYADDNRTKALSLTPDWFLGRFLLHVLPPGYTRIRLYGFLANRDRRRASRPGRRRCRGALPCLPPDCDAGPPLLPTAFPTAAHPTCAHPGLGHFVAVAANSLAVWS